MNRTLALFLAFFLCFSFTAVSFPTEAVGGYVGKKVAKKVAKQVLKKNTKKAVKPKPKAKPKKQPKKKTANDGKSANNASKSSKKASGFKDRTRSASNNTNSSLKPRSATTPKKAPNAIKQANNKFTQNAKSGSNHKINKLSRDIRRDKCKGLSASGCDAKINQTLQQKGLLKNSTAAKPVKSAPKNNAYASSSHTPAKKLSFPSKRGHGSSSDGKPPPHSPPKPAKITGYTKHGLNQAISRNGGRGVNIKSMLEAVRNPKKVTQNPKNGTTKFVGHDRTTVILNKDGKVVTTYGKARGDKIYNEGTKRKQGSGSAQRKANEKGFSYNPKSIK